MGGSNSGGMRGIRHAVVLLDKVDLVLVIRLVADLDYAPDFTAKLVNGGGFVDQSNRRLHLAVADERRQLR